MGNRDVAVGARRESWAAVGNQGVALRDRCESCGAVRNRGVALGARRESWLAVGNLMVQLPGCQEHCPALHTRHTARHKRLPLAARMEV